MTAGEQRIPLLQLLVNRCPEQNRKELYSAVLCGEIFVDGERIRDPKSSVLSGSDVQRIRNRYVGRGGGKLDGALRAFDINPMGWVCLDAGASTGGFTDCLLSRGAEKVYAVDVGYNQIAWKLRTHPRVRLWERTNLMQVVPEDMDPLPDFAVADLSFRSLRGAASHLLNLTQGRPVLALAKPQFENPQEPDFKGVVRSHKARSEVIISLRKDFLQENVWIHDAVASMIAGKKGNGEIFLILSGIPPKNTDYVDKKIRIALDDIDR